MLSYLTMGTLLGLSAGFAPGPLLTLVISETLNYGMRAGIKVALAPILTDLPIIVLTLAILAKLSGFEMVLGIISFLGAVFVLYMGYESFRTKGMDISPEAPVSHSFKKGIVVNFLNPHPYLFWFSVGTPLMLKAMDESFLSATAFIICFYVFLVGSKIVLAVIIGKSRAFLKGRIYIFIMRLLGLALFAFAVVLFRDGLRFLGVI
ncbi:LysE family translocator [Thermodesulfobacteriota bacterium]